MTTALLGQMLHIPAAQWVTVINTFHDQLGTPTLVMPDGPLADADQVAWGTGDAELRCIKEYNVNFIPSSGEYFAGCYSTAQTTKAFNFLKTAGFKVKEELHTIQVYTLVGVEIKKQDILLGSFYLHPPQISKPLKEYDVLGVIHNPNYPDSLRLKLWHGAHASTQVLSYCLAGVVGAALATWLGRRS